MMPQWMTRLSSCLQCDIICRWQITIHKVTRETYWSGNCHWRTGRQGALTQTDQQRCHSTAVVLGNGKLLSAAPFQSQFQLVRSDLSTEPWLTTDNSTRKAYQRRKARHRRRQQVLYSNVLMVTLYCLFRQICRHLVHLYFAAFFQICCKNTLFLCQHDVLSCRHFTELTDNNINTPLPNRQSVSGIVSCGNAWKMHSQSYFDRGNSVPRHAIVR